jgi:hypothetical protein
MDLMAGISQIIRWRQGRAVISHRSVQQKARSGDAAASSSSNNAPAPQPSTKVSLSGSTQATTATYLEKLKRKAKAGLQGTRVGALNAVNRETNKTSGAVPATDASTATMQQSLREALSQFVALAEPAPPPEPPPPRETSTTTPAPAGDGSGIAVSWDVDATYEWDTLMQDAQHARKDEADNATATDASEAPPTPTES